MATNNTRQAAWVAIGSFCSFLVGIVSPMILSRYFDKADYGTYKQVMYVYNTLLAVFTLGLPKAYAYFLPKFPIQKSKDIINKITRIFFILGVVFSLFLFLCSAPIAHFLKNPDLELALKIFSPTPLLLLPTMGLDGIYAAFKKTQYTAIYTVITRILTIVCIILPVVWTKGNYIHAIIGFDVASLITCIVALYMKSWPVKDVDHEPSGLRYKEIFDFALPLLYASMWGIIIASANQCFISRYYGVEVFAEFSNGFMEIPFAGMILGGVSAVLLPAFSGIDKGQGLEKDAFDLWRSCMRKSAMLIFPILIYCVFCARLVMTCAYSSRYDSSTIYFQIKNLSGLAHIIPFAPLILAIGKTKAYARVHMVIAIMIVLLEYITVHIFDTAIAIAVVSELCQLAKVIIMMWVVARYAKMTILQLLPKKDLFIVLLLSVIAGLGSWLSVHFIEGNKFVLLGISFVVFVAIYYILCWEFKLSYKPILSSLLEKKKLSHLLRFIP